MNAQARPFRVFGHVAFALLLGAAETQFGAPAAAAPPFRFSVIDLGVLRDGDTSSVARDINNRGQIVGESLTTQMRSAFVWSTTDGILDLGRFGTTTATFAFGINDAGTVVGSSGSGAFIWEPATGMRSVSSEAGGHSLIGAYAINNAGQVVGDWYVFEYWDAFRWTPGSGPIRINPSSQGSDLSVSSDEYAIDGEQQVSIIDPTIANSTNAKDINNLGFVIGHGPPSGRAFLWTPDDGFEFLTIAPGDASFSSTFAEGINDRGQIVGWGSVPNHAFIWSKEGGMIDLGVPDASFSSSVAYDINELSQVVGYGHIPSIRDRRATLWTLDSGMLDLNTLLDDSGAGWILKEATAINDLGQIVGNGINPAGQERAFLLTPVPEPHSLVLAGIAAVAFIGWAARARRNRKLGRHV